MAATFLRPSSFGPPDRQYLSQRFEGQGRVVKLLAWALLDIREMRKMEQNVLQGDDSTVMSFKDSQTTAVGMTAVASAIIASLSSSTLKISGISDVHWTPSGFVITSLLLSVLSTLLSVIQQQIFSALSGPSGVRMWLSNGMARHRGSTSKNAFTQKGANKNIKTSVASYLLLRLPNAFLLYAVACYLLGFGLFLGLAWKMKLNNTPSKDNNFAVMLLFAIVGSVSFLGTGSVLRWKMSEVQRAEVLVGGDIEEGPEGDDGGAGGSADGDDGGRDNEDLLAKMNHQTAFTEDEVRHHEQIAKALEDAAKAHRDLAKLMRDVIQLGGDD